ncbi:MAG: hypothetical protein RR033_03115 [Clostridia bacterium]
MSKRNKRNVLKISKVLSYIVIVLIFVAVCGALAFFTNGFTGDFKTFYAVVGDKYIMTSADGYIFTNDQPLIVDVNYTFGVFSAEQTGYSVKVIPNVDSKNDFAFTVDGETHSFSAEKDLTQGFVIVQSEKSFSIAPKGDLKAILSALYTDTKIELDSSKIDFSKDLFKVVITSYNDEASVFITCSLYLTVDSIEINKTEIVF